MESAAIWKSMCQCTERLSATQCGRGSKEFQHPIGIKPMSPDSLQPVFTTNLAPSHKFIIILICWKEQCVNCHDLQTWLIFACRIVILRLLKLNIKARQKNRKPIIDKWYCIGHRLELKIFSLHNFCSMLIKQLVLSKLRTDRLRKLRIENLKFRADLGDWVMDHWSLTQ